MTPDQFNALYPVGTRVRAYPGCRPKPGATGKHCCEVLDTVTRSTAQMLGGHTPVVWVKGHGACISLDFVDIIPTVVGEAS